MELSKVEYGAIDMLGSDYGVNQVGGYLLASDIMGRE